MSAVMSGNDSVVVLPTGGGKSLCFQAPAVTMGGMGIVVSPLIALMKDQVDALRNCGVAADYVNSSLSQEERRAVSDRVLAGEVKLLYAAPERLLMNGTIKFLQRANVSLIAIDEAHCISSWGHDFRPEYRGLKALKDAFPEVGVHAYTATASEAVRNDIAQQLGLQGPQGGGPTMLVGSFDRPNLTYRVRPGVRKLDQIREVIQRHSTEKGSESGIVYCISRKEVDKTAAALEASGIRALPYHAGLDDQQRKKNQDAFLSDRCDVIVATVAFGMGIDKPDVRFVIHAGMPKSVEHYQQEAGRAGRDGLPAECLLLYSRGDAATWRRMLSAPSEDSTPESIEGALQALEGIVRYGAGVTCRHRALVEHFGQELDKENCGACDVCLGDLDLVDSPVVLAQKILSCVVRLEQRYGADYTCKVLCGSQEERIVQSGHDQLSTHGLLSDQKSSDVRDWVEQLVAQQYLEKTGDYGLLQLTQLGLKLLKGEGEPRLLKTSRSSKRSSSRPDDDWQGVDSGLFEKLRELRTAKATDLGVPAYIVFGDASLRDLARRRPTTLEAFRAAHGVGEKKLKEYGQEFLKLIQSHCDEQGLETDLESPKDSKRSETSHRVDGPQASAMAAFPHFREGQSVEEVAQIMGRATSTTFGYLSEYLRHDQVTDPSPWIEESEAKQIEQAIEEVGLKALKPIHEHLGGQIDYNAIKVVATCIANRTV